MGIQINKVAVVGANGFIGRSLIDFLNAKGIQTLEFTSNQPVIDKGQINRSIDHVSSVIWCASHVNPISAEIRPDLVKLEITEWNYFLNNWEKVYGGEKSVIFLSSGGCTYSGQIQPFTEDSLAEGINQYGKLKVAMEKDLLGRNLHSYVLRAANVYGPNQPHAKGQGVIAVWKNAIENRKDIKVFGSLENYRDYIFIDDLCEGILRTLGFDNSSQILNLGGGYPISLEKILGVFKSLVQDKTKIVLEEKRSSDRDGYFLDISKFSRLTNWQPKFSIDEGLLRTIVF
jgi:UDP-glucose 4-epimerase